MAEVFRIALAGNPNSGKTTLFNALTGSRHSVGNWPGVTVEKKEGRVTHKEQSIGVIDLPGTYSLSPYSIEEKIARNYIVEEQPDVVINIVDASNIERNLYLSLQLIELGRPVIVALNMMDAAQKKGYKIDTKKLSDLLGVPVVSLIATKKKGIKELLDAVIKLVQVKQDFGSYPIKYGKELENKIMQIVDVLEGKEEIYKYNPRWLAIKILEEDDGIADLLSIHGNNGMAAIDVYKSEEDYESIIADKRYNYIQNIISRAVKKPAEEQLTLSDKIDKIVTNKWLGLPIFALLMYSVFWLTFSIGDIFIEMIEGGFELLGEMAAGALERAGTALWLQSLVADGIIAGVGAVLSFLPVIILLFIAISLLEDSGYMARAAFIMDRAMRKIGLSGKAFVPMLMGFGCSVPAIMATRTLEEENDRLATILVTPFMSCGARLPIYVLFAGVFFPGRQSQVVFSLYILGIIIAVLMALLFKHTLFKGQSAPFIMELPPYRIPTFKTTGIHVWERVKAYILRAGTVIFGASIVIWFLLGFNFSGPAEISESIGAGIGKIFAPIFKPLGFGTWEAAVSLIAGLLAKEVVVSSMAVIYGLGEAVGEAAMEGNIAGFANVLKDVGFNSLSAYSFMVFTLLYMPCIAVFGVIKRETNSWKWTGFSVAYTSAVAWVVSVIIFQGGKLLGF